MIGNVRQDDRSVYGCTDVLEILRFDFFTRRGIFIFFCHEDRNFCENVVFFNVYDLRNSIEG